MQVLLQAQQFTVITAYTTPNTNKTIKTAPAETKEAAYTLGLAKLNQLKAESGNELSNELALPLSSFQQKNSVTLKDNANITQQEMMNPQGHVVYTGLVNITYSYSQAN